MTTVWGGVLFTDPVLWARWVPPPGGGIYLILARRPDSDPQSQDAPVYVGETPSFSEHVTEAHARFECWAREALGTGHLYVVVHDAADRGQHAQLWRWGMQERLIERLNPPCNRRPRLL